MRGRTIGIIAGAALLWVVAPLSASATGCGVNADASIAVPGDKSASGEADCSTVVSASAQGSLAQDETGAEIGREVDLDVLGEDEDGTDPPTYEGKTGFDCPPEEDAGSVTSIVCLALRTS